MFVCVSLCVCEWRVCVCGGGCENKNLERERVEEKNFDYNYKALLLFIFAKLILKHSTRLKKWLFSVVKLFSFF